MSGELLHEMSMKIDEVKQATQTKPAETQQQPPQQQQQRRSLSRATHTMLTDIFQKIGTKDETKEGLTLLYDFMQQHPEADIEPFLMKSSKFFQDYIQNGLREIEESRRAHAAAIPPKTTLGRLVSLTDEYET